MITLPSYDAVAEPRRINLLALTLAGVLALLTLMVLRWHGTLIWAAILFGGVFLLWAARYTRLHVEWLVLAMLLSEVVPSTTFFNDSTRPMVRYALMLLFCLPMLPRTWRSGLLGQGGFRLYLIYFVIAMSSVLYSLVPAYSFVRVMGGLILFAATCAVAAEVRDNDDIRRLFGIFWIGSSIIIALLALSALVLPANVTWVADKWSGGPVRFAGIFGSPNQVGEIMLTTVASGLLYWPAASKCVRIAIAITLTLSLLFDVMADSRSAFVALAIGVFFYTVRVWRWRAVVTWVAGLALIVGIASTFSRSTLEYVNRGGVTTLTGRTEIWRYTIGKIEQRPLLGYGYEVEGQIFQNRLFPLWEDLWDQGPHSSLHSGYLARAVGVGIPATLLWLFFIIRALIAALRGKGPFRLADAVLLGAVPIMILNIDESTVADCRYSVGLLLAMVWALAERSRLMEKRQRADEAEESRHLFA